MQKHRMRTVMKIGSRTTMNDQLQGGFEPKCWKNIVQTSTSRNFREPFNSKPSKIEKVKMAKNYGLGGIMNWAIDIDDFKGTFCGQETIFDSPTHYHTFAIMSGLSTFPSKKKTLDKILKFSNFVKRDPIRCWMRQNESGTQVSDW